LYFINFIIDIVRGVVRAQDSTTAHLYRDLYNNLVTYYFSLSYSFPTQELIGQYVRDKL
jgi:hypothetical protein